MGLSVGKSLGSRQRYYSLLTFPLQIPQLIENYQNDSADGISLVFLFVWLLGDLTNLAGVYIATSGPLF